MKHIKLSHIILPVKDSVYIRDKHYWVCLGNEARVEFNGIMEAKRFLAQTNKYLTQELHQLNAIYINALQLYRHNWFYFLDDCKLIRNAIELVEKNFDLVVTKGGTTNGNHFLFSYLSHIIENVHFILYSTWNSLNDAKKYNEIRSVNINILQLARLKSRIESWGKSGFKEPEISNIFENTDFQFLDNPEKV